MITQLNFPMFITCSILDLSFAFDYEIVQIVLSVTALSSHEQPSNLVCSYKIPFIMMLYYPCVLFLRETLGFSIIQYSSDNLSE